MYVIIIRTFLLYIIIIFAMRIMGKRQLGELQPSELVITILISNIATLPIEDFNIPLLSGAIPILSLVCYEVFVSAITLKVRAARRIVSGNPMIIINHGVIDQKALRNLRFSVDDLMEQLRDKDIFDIREVAFAVVETTGKLSVYPKAPKRPATAEQLGVVTQPNEDFPPMAIISDGQLDEDALQLYGIEKKWVTQTVASHGYAMENVLLMTCTKDLDYYIVTKDRTRRG